MGKQEQSPRSKCSGNRALMLIALFIVAVVWTQWNLATHYLKVINTHDDLKNSLYSFVRQDGIDIGKSARSHLQNYVGQIYSKEEPSLPAVFTAVDEQHLHTGRVIRELSHRVLSRNIAQSNVIVVSPNYREVVVHDEKSKQLLSTDPVYYIARDAIQQGHITHLIPSSVDFANGWVDNKHSEQRHNSTSVGWILLAYFATHDLDSAFDNTPTIDEILSPSNEAVKLWLSQTTITYIVFPIQATAKVQLSSILTNKDYAYEMDYTVDKTITMLGLDAAQTLLRSNYKLQLLSSSHYFDAEDPTFYYGPNALFQNRKQLHRFLYQRITEILRAEARNLRKARRDANMKIGNGQEALEVHFHALLFATQGLDLAIPARSSYVDVGNHMVCKDADGNRMKRCDPKLKPRAQNDTIFLNCPKRHDLVTVNFAHGGGEVYRLIERIPRATALEKANDILVTIKGEWLVEKDVETGEIEVWRGHEDRKKAEAVCVKTDKSSLLPSVACTTRIVPVLPTIGRIQPGEKEKPNLLLVMIDPLSRQQLRRSLPNTWALLDLMGFEDFPKYTAVGKNSGPNQSALYSGVPLDGRDIRSSTNTTDRIWLWDRFRDAGYVTMKAEDGCVSNSNMVQSIDPQTHHGKQLHEMFCYSHDRPNCLGSKLAAEHLVDYTLTFIKKYDRNKPWAAFVSFIDSHEDTSTLVTYLDDLLMKFLQQVIAAQDTMILFLSDHGLHYGSTLESTGAVEQVQPVLMMRLPTFRKNGLHSGSSMIHANSDKYITPFDVHETILHFILYTSSNSTHGIALDKKTLPIERNICKRTQEIPSEFCALIARTYSRKHDQCVFMTDPPSIMSFYSDIPRRNRPIWPDRCPLRRNHSYDAATSEDEECSEFKDDNSYVLQSCGWHDKDKRMKLKIDVTRNERLVEERKTRAINVTGGENDGSPPNIIFLEIDSVSLSQSERFFPKTWSLLKRHEIVHDNDGLTCPTGWCSVAYNRTSVVGQSSIVNQLAALSGCTDKDEQKKLKLYKPATYCYSNDKESSTEDDHWIFEIARRIGYVTFFGEEFCYEDSPYVVQTQTAFKLNEDLSPHKLFCDLAKESMRIGGSINSKTIQTYSVEYESQEVPDSCFDGLSRGEIGFTYIRQMFEKYHDLPKFAFLNALAAHDYSLDSAHVSLGAESYDSSVFNFLSTIMSLKGDRPTYIILRSDHGLQGGPFPVDQSTQIEHMHPWTAIIAPVSHIQTSQSIDTIASNQDKLVTGFDLYHSIRYLMSPFKDKNKAEGLPPWSYNLLTQSIPNSRNCKDARIPIIFCPCINERTDMTASFYVGYSERPQLLHGKPNLQYNWETQQFIPLRPIGVQSQKLKAKHIAKPNPPIVQVECNATLGQYINEDMLIESWKMIENITAVYYAGSEVSGGIFLYPRQAIVLSYLLQKEITSKVRRIDEKEPFRVCETGFGNGHSAALFLSASPEVEVVSFDLFNRPYQTASVIALNSYFGGNRLKQIIGNSCDTYKSYSSRCDFLHGSSLCETDNIDLIHGSGAGVTLTSTAMNSLEDSSVYFGRRPKWAVKQHGAEDAQWATLQNQGCIENITCFEEESRTLDSNLRLARGKEQTISHKFCIAINTGKCSKVHFHPRKSSWESNDFCTQWEIIHK